MKLMSGLCIGKATGVAAFAGAHLVALAWLYLAPDWTAGRQVAILFPPGTSQSTMVAAVAEAGGRLVRQGGWSDVLVAGSDRPDFPHRLRVAGAWAVLSPVVAGACFTSGSGNALGEET